MEFCKIPALFLLPLPLAEFLNEDTAALSITDSLNKEVAAWKKENWEFSYILKNSSKNIITNWSLLQQDNIHGAVL